jgi:hypothetical protein
MLQTIKLTDWSGLPTNFTGIVERRSGTKFWFVNGKFHREDGPVVERADGTKYWYLNGKKYSEEQWKIEVEKLRLGSGASPKCVDNEVTTCQGETATEKKEEKVYKMEIINETKKAGRRVASRKLVKSVKAMMMKLLAGKGKTKAQKNAISQALDEILSTREGEALLGFAIGAAIPHVVKMGPVQKFEGLLLPLGEELRISGMAEAGDSLMDRIGEALPSLGGEVLELLNGLQATETDDSSNTGVRASTKELSSVTLADVAEIDSTKSAKKISR